ncbi:MAG: ASPIC/UnbV domain-containing protein, partial [Acidobacteriota bacterium]|nr:ASPIC/UnbV domain-containing protein [Acidobacteriota bacterium]
QLRQKNFENASVSLEKAKRLAPENSSVYFNLAILALQNDDTASLTTNLQKVRELDPDDLRPVYLLAVENEKQKKDSEALAGFEEILKVKSDNLAALIESARLHAKTGDEKGLKNDLSKLEGLSKDWPQAAASQFAKLKQTPVASASTEIAFLRNVLLRLPAFRASIDKIKPSDTVVGELINQPLVLAVPDFSPAEPDTGIEFTAEVISDQPAQSVSIVFLDGEAAVAAVSGEKNTKVGDFVLPISATVARQLSVSDLDYDYKNDISYAGKEGFRLFRQTSGKKFIDVTKLSGLSTELNQGVEYNGVWSFDFDNEGDLDLLLASEDEAFVLVNKGVAKTTDGSPSGSAFEKLLPFKNIRGVTDFRYADLDEDGDSDAVFLLKNGEVSFFANERGGLFKSAENRLAENIAAISVGDTTGDGTLELVLLSNKGILSRLGLVKRPSELSVDTGLGDCGSNCRLFIADLDNSGANDFVVTNGETSKVFLGKSDGVPVQAKANIGAAVTDLADMDGDGKLDLVGLSKEARAVKLINKSRKNYNWQIVRPRSAKTEGDQRVNTFGIGGEIETRAGLAVQKKLIRSPQVHFGLGNAKQTDVIRVVWQNGYVQAEFDIKPNQVIAAEQRLKGSCPHLFAWNGTEFAHVKDAPPWSPALGLKINAQDTFGILQTEEWFKIPGEALKPKDGFYELRITGEYWEAYYIDHYRLVVVDHPDDTEVFTDERFAIPLPPLEVFTTGKTRLFERAVDHNGKDVSEVVSALDEEYLDGIKRGRYQGVAEDHYVELELPEDAPRDKKLWIVADGWVHPTDASINVQRGQDVPVPPKSLSIEVQDENGVWKTAKENLGFPAGKMKTVLLDLDGVFPKSTLSRKLRLRTEMEVFWDKLAWAIAKEGDSNFTKELDLHSAELRYRGFSVIEKPDDSSPEVPDYNRIMTTGQRWRDLVGYYTRFGDVRELLLKTDDRYVLANAGDEIVMKFPELPPVKNGYTRDFVIIGNGWIKDGDLNSVFSKTVLPLPTQASNDYSKPPGELEDDPVYRKNRKDWIDFHTRYVAPDRFRNALR